MSESTLGAGTVLTGRVTNWPMIWLTTALVVPLLTMAGPAHTELREPSFLIPLGIALLAVLVNLVTLSSLRTTVGPQGIAVYFGAFGWPRFRYPIGRIRRVTATRVTGVQLAWGITWTPRRGLGLTIRNGPAVALELDSGRKVTIGVPDADAAVRVLAAAGCPTG